MVTVYLAPLTYKHTSSFYLMFVVHIWFIHTVLLSFSLGYTSTCIGSDCLFPTKMALSNEYLEDLKNRFEDMGIKPECKSKEDLEKWMYDYLQSQGKIPPGKTDTDSDRDSDDDHKGHSDLNKSYIPVHKISTFTGKKGELSFDLWKHEIECLKQDNIPEHTILRLARRSLKGDPGKMSMRLGPHVTLEQLLDKLESVYGLVDLGDSVMSKFYCAKQKDTEDVVSWGCRLEELISQAIELGEIQESEANKKLMSRFVFGLKKNLKDRMDVEKHQYTEFDKLRTRARQLELEIEVGSFSDSSTKSKMGHTKSISAGGTTLTEIKTAVSNLSSKVDEVSAKVNKFDQNQTGIFQPFSPGRETAHSFQNTQRAYNPYSYQFNQGQQNFALRPSGFRYRAPDTQNSQNYAQRLPRFSNSRFRGRPRPNFQNSMRFPNTGSQTRFHTLPKCHNCGQPGHVVAGCRIPKNYQGNY